MNPCQACAASNGSCCRNRQILLTHYDIERIQRATGNLDFYIYEMPEPDYIEQDDDPIWNVITLLDDGTRRVIKRRPGGDCRFLYNHVCSLSVEVRPLICRIHPYLYDETNLQGFHAACSIFRRPDAALILEKINMPVYKAEGWRRQLYHELVIEKAARAGDLATSRSSGFLHSHGLNLDKYRSPE